MPLLEQYGHDLLRRVWARLPQQSRDRLLQRLVALTLGPPDLDTSQDPYHAVFQEFVTQVNALRRPRILEVGARARSGVTRKSLFPDAEYVGFDIHAGPNVDVVGDAHALSTSFPAGHFDAVFAISVFEHLAMPWKVVLEMNAVLKIGGIICIQTHPTWPSHELPWDFWRFSREAFPVLLNATTGFELLRCDEGLPCSIVPFGSEPPMLGVPRQPAHLGVVALARKVGDPDPRLRWDVGVEEILSTRYPKPEPTQGVSGTST